MYLTTKVLILRKRTKKSDLLQLDRKENVNIGRKKEREKRESKKREGER